jgi:RNA polymerase sigma factor (sigma-70 family)
VNEATEWLTPQALTCFREGLRMVALRALGASDLADDVAQEVLARGIAAAQSGRLTPDDNVGAYLHGIARHVIADTRRLRGREPTVPPEVETTPIAAVALGSLIAEEERARVRGALKGLSEGDRAILRLSFYDDLNSAEIARRMGVPASRIRKRKSRALERLRQAFAAARHTSDVGPDK